MYPISALTSSTNPSLQTHTDHSHALIPSHPAWCFPSQLSSSCGLQITVITPVLPAGTLDTQTVIRWLLPTGSWYWEVRTDSKKYLGCDYNHPFFVRYLFSVYKTLRWIKSISELIARTSCSCTERSVKVFLLIIKLIKILYSSISWLHHAPDQTYFPIIAYFINIFYEVLSNILCNFSWNKLDLQQCSARIDFLLV